MGNFHETRMGHEFYLGTMPMIKQALEDNAKQSKEINENLNRLNENIERLISIVSIK